MIYVKIFMKIQKNFILLGHEFCGNFMGGFHNRININIVNGGFPPPMPAFGWGGGEGFFGGMFLASLFGGQRCEMPSYNPCCGFSGYDLVQNSAFTNYDSCPCSGGYNLFSAGNSGSYYTDFGSTYGGNNFATPAFDSYNYFNFTPNTSSYNSWLSSLWIGYGGYYIKQFKRRYDC